MILKLVSTPLCQLHNLVGRGLKQNEEGKLQCFNCLLFSDMNIAEL